MIRSGNRVQFRHGILGFPTAQGEERWKIGRLEDWRDGRGEGWGIHPPFRSSVVPSLLNWHVGHVTFAWFDGAQEYLVCLYWKRLPKSYGGRVISPYGVGPS